MVNGWRRSQQAESNRIESNRHSWEVRSDSLGPNLSQSRPHSSDDRPRGLSGTCQSLSRDLSLEELGTRLQSGTQPWTFPSQANVQAIAISLPSSRVQRRIIRPVAATNLHNSKGTLHAYCVNTNEQRMRPVSCGRTRMHVVRVVRSFKVRLIRHPREIRFYRFSVTAMHSMIYLVSFAGKEKLLW